MAPPPKAPRRSNQELVEALEHLRYEYSMLFAVAEALSSSLALNRLLKNALLESSAIHFRSLVDFLYRPANARSDDMAAEDFFADQARWSEARVRVHARSAAQRRRLMRWRWSAQPARSMVTMACPVRRYARMEASRTVATSPARGLEIGSAVAMTGSPGTGGGQPLGRARTRLSGALSATGMWELPTLCSQRTVAILTYAWHALTYENHCTLG